MGAEPKSKAMGPLPSSLTRSSSFQLFTTTERCFHWGTTQKPSDLSLAR